MDKDDETKKSLMKLNTDNSQQTTKVFCQWKSINTITVQACVYSPSFIAQRPVMMMAAIFNMSAPVRQVGLRGFVNPFHAAGVSRRQVKNVQKKWFHDHIWNHREKCIQNSTNMSGIGSLIRDIAVNISEIWESKRNLLSKPRPLGSFGMYFSTVIPNTVIQPFSIFEWNILGMSSANVCRVVHLFLHDVLYGMISMVQYICVRLMSSLSMFLLVKISFFLEKRLINAC